MMDYSDITEEKKLQKTKFHVLEDSRVGSDPFSPTLSKIFSVWNNPLETNFTVKV